MINIKAKYYTYNTHEFMPIYSDGLVNKREFHIYKFKRFIWSIRNMDVVYYRWTHKSSFGNF